jgi:predicted dehydrogenase/threonine dehydrogenase-like Zn-dependent dehydrogenase
LGNTIFKKIRVIMLQIIQNLKTGATILENVPTPMVQRGHVLIRTKASLVSLGTEKMLVEFGKSSLIAKARQQPDRVKQVLDKIKTEGLLPTLEAVFNKLDQPLPLGYCNAGQVIAVGEGVHNFKIGDRVVSNGSHAEFVCVPKNLVARIPDEVSYEEASFAVIGSVGLQGIRLAKPGFGETFVVVGLGLIGLLTAQLLVANGCNVIGFDFDSNKVDLANKMGAKAFLASSVDVVKIVESFTNGVGADAVIITASTKSNEVISQAAKLSRKRGRIILVGVIGLELNRADFYKKELTFQVSCSYGPGRYDDSYESEGNDYPIAFVRWTENRNFDAILQAIASKKLNVSDLITERVDLQNYMHIYGYMGKGSIASILIYSNVAEPATTVNVSKGSSLPSQGRIGIIGAGNFTKMTLMPALKKVGAPVSFISSAGGLSAKSLANKYSIQYCTTDYREILKSEEVDLVMITTRHDLHAQMAIEGIRSGKSVFVEKPLALNQAELTSVIGAYNDNKGRYSIHVGFNRRFAPTSVKAKELLNQSVSPINMIATMNAGFIPPEIWVHDLKIGGGRIIGEACHFIDLMIYLSGSLVTEVHMSALGINYQENTDNAIITLKFQDGSQGVINYFSNGSKSYAKERIEIYQDNKTLVLDNFKSLTGYGFREFSSFKTGLDKGHAAQFKRLVQITKSGSEQLISINELENSSLASFAAIESLKTKSRIFI